jgi:hypothetical protein
MNPRRIHTPAATADGAALDSNGESVNHESIDGADVVVWYAAHAAPDFASLVGLGSRFASPIAVSEQAREECQV